MNIFSGKLYTGEKLDQLGGIAAILRFPLNMDYLDKSSEDSNEREPESDSEVDYSVPE